MGAPFVTSQRLRFCDTDMLGHVNNAVYAVMYEAGRAELMAHTGLLDAASGRGVVIARLEIDFLAEMNWPGEVRIETWFARIGNKSLHARQRLLVEDAVVSRATSVLAVIDTITRKAVPIDPAWRERLGAWLIGDAISDSQGERAQLREKTGVARSGLGQGDAAREVDEWHRRT